ncbi:MAG TPA: VTT domain-containing protein [Limnobacter sp.]|uniref:VTT domain-containing protein n=1 Tax=Limnobacter sp. TaxID=2003368 RepID=UPI002EDAFB40
MNVMGGGMGVSDTRELLVFVNVLLQQLGAPVPAVPTMVVTAGLSTSWANVVVLAMVATLASLLADWVWYAAGRYYGYRVLSGLCRLSINPESCVSTTELRFRNWGPWSLVLAKFIPGFSTVAPPIAGAVKMPVLNFTLASALGAFLWAFAAMLAGWLFQDQVSALFDVFRSNWMAMLLVVGLIVSVWLLWKISRRLAYAAKMKSPRISPADLQQFLGSVNEPVRLLDLRPEPIKQAEPLAGWLDANPDTVLAQASQWGAGDVIVTMCACPGDVTANHVASTLQEAGFLNAKTLEGGYGAWSAHLQKKSV